MNRPHRPKQARAFTLVELLVVIGIIGLLVAILLPVVSKIRASANNAASQNVIMQISQAIQNYYNDQQQYPGATPDASFGAISNPPYDNSLVNLTSTEDLVVSLMGGYSIVATPGKITFDYTLLGKGPISLAPLTGGQPGQKGPYMDVQPKMLSAIPTQANPNITLKDTGEWLSYTAGKDTTIPEFMDQFGDARPILYVRANPAAKRQPTADTLVKWSPTVYDPTAYYNFRSVAAYFRPYDVTYKDDLTIPSNRKNDVFAIPLRTIPDAGSSPTTSDQTRVNDYFRAQDVVPTNPITYSARGAGSYMLISAGLDRRYGTPDDIVFTSSGGGQ